MKMKLVPKVPLEHIVTVVSRTPRSHLITETALSCVKHEPEDREALRAKIERIVKKLELAD